MRILVIDDKQIHRDSAVATLAGHTLTIMSRFDEAMQLLVKKRVDYVNVERILAKDGIRKPGDSGDTEGWEVFRKAHGDAMAESTTHFPFEVVLTDMMLPMAHNNLADGIFKPGEIVPYGFIIALKAALCGAKYIAMLTDTNHHYGAMSAALDHVGSSYYQNGFRPNFVINGARTMFVHAPLLQGGGKSWGQVLADLTAE